MMRRIEFLFVALLSWATLQFPSPAAAPQAALVDLRPAYHLPLDLTAAQKERLAKALDPLHAQYDPAERMLRQPFSSPGYHTTLKGGTVHSTRSSLAYAIALLDTGDDQWLDRACQILRRVIALQDKNPTSKTYGIWSWFKEEPLDKMSPPDWNWADFCGALLLQAALYHHDRLPPDLQKELDAAILHAARSIQRRNVGPDYTNIAIMGTYVTLVTAELYGLEDLRQYALARWQRFYDYTMRSRAFTEYNSPTYTIVALKELGRMRQHVRAPEARQTIEEIYRLAWEEIAVHFHPPTRQWAGPHSRSYSTLLRTEPLAVIQRGTEGRVSFEVDRPTIDDYRPPLPCPPEFEPFFISLKEPRTLIKTFAKTDPPVIGTTRLEQSFTLGSINRGDLWNQRRALLAYWGTAQKTSYLHLRFLHDNYDFSAAQFFSRQKDGQVLAGINFAVDGGNTHVSLDKLKDGSFRAKDLRLRFEFGGAAGKETLPVPSSLTAPARLRFDDLRLDLAVAFAQFGPAHGRWESGKDRDKAWLDVVLYFGQEQKFNLHEISTAALALAVRFATTDLPTPSIKTQQDNDTLTLHWDDLRLTLPTRPAKKSALHNSQQPPRQPWTN